MLPTDGLTQPWAGRVWLNPPYGPYTWRWLDKLADHGDGIALVFARTDTKGFMLAWRRATALYFFEGRIRFHRADNGLPADAPGAPSVALAFGDRNVAALERLAEAGYPGVLVSGWKQIEATGLFAKR